MSIGQGLSFVVAAFATVLAPFAAKAQGRDCRPQTALSAPSVTPELFRVGGSDPVPFVFGGSNDPKCPGPILGCRRPEQLASGDLVVVTGLSGPFACATTVGPPPALREIHGWAPAARLVRVRGGGGAAWAGTWRTSFDQKIRIRKRDRGGLSLTGSATWGAGDASRVAQGLVNTGELAARATPSGDHLEFASSGCEGRMWRLGPYLVVGDNNRCGGTNVTFSGVYRQAGASP
jgi:hypothetical protein